MAKIVQLPIELTNQIAAGEVVERPASIIKELLENSIDAGANTISIELKDGGCEGIKITDNGSGIPADDIPLVFSRYATSKITTFEDLYHIMSYGFRGEALASIASVARVELISKEANSLSAIKIVIENGAILETTPIGAPTGTIIDVSNIFASLPVRKKFLKSPQTELGCVLEAIIRIMLPHPHIKVTIHNNGKEVGFYPACQDIHERASTVLGKIFEAKMRTFRTTSNGITVSGIASAPDKSMTNSKSVYVFTNNRFIKDYLVNHAIMGAYRHLMESKRYPCALLFIDIDPAEIDINVHPTKMEVRFRQPRIIYDIISTAISSALSKADFSQTATAASASPSASNYGTSEYKRRVEEALQRYSFQTPNTQSFVREKTKGFLSDETVISSQPLSNNIRYGNNDDVADAQQQFKEAPIRLSSRHYLGQVHNTYLVVEGDTGIIIVDQHAIHERIVFEKLKKNMLGGGVLSQELLIPEVVNLSKREMLALADTKDFFAEFGFNIEPFGNDDYIIKSIPDTLANSPIQDVIVDMLSEFINTTTKPNINEIREKCSSVWHVMVQLEQTNNFQNKKQKHFYFRWKM
ncbi:MAG: DNA mismatch repair endonuclease MutL [Deltaproteobacteria bacterium]